MPVSTGAPHRTIPDSGWYKDAVLYELHVRAFQDSNADGIGDFPGLTSRLPYLQELGVTALWLLPFYPSPLRDDGYDIADYTSVHRDYGTIDDFRTFLDEAHRRGLRVITELVVNHTSNEHPWFRRARQAAPGSAQRDFYVWSDSPERYAGTRIIFQDFEQSNWSWDPVARSYFWHRFYSHQPDLNYDNPAVLDAVLEVIDFWLGLGVDGMRLDAVPYLVERDGTSSENLPSTHAILKRIRAHVDERFADRVFIAEANQWPEDAAAYFGDGDESHMVFHFPLMPRLFMAIRQEDRLPIVDILAQTPAIPESCQWALFLRNHDELTLEMVTEEERLYMYHVYATDPAARINLGIRRRLAPLMGNDRRRIELMNGLLCSLPGTPVIYYGDEIGMGDNIYLGDRNGVRTPMQWSPDRNAGFSDASPQRLYLPLVIDEEYHYQSTQVESQERNRHSLLWWTRRLLALRQRYRAFGRGDFKLVDGSNRRVLAFLRQWDAQRLLVVANLSRFSQHVELDLSTLAGDVPVDVFGRTAFPAVTTAPYSMVLGPHTFHWFELQEAATRDDEQAMHGSELNLPAWEALLEHPTRAALEALLARVVEPTIAWTSEARPVLTVTIVEGLLVTATPRPLWLMLARVSFAVGEPQVYLLALGCRASAGDDTRAVATLVFPDGEREVLYDASHEPDLGRWLVAALSADGSVRGSSGTWQLSSVHGGWSPGAAAAGPAQVLGHDAPATNAVVGIGGEFVVKLFGQVEEGIEPEAEIGEYLTARGFPGAVPLLATIRYRPSRRPDGQGVTVGVVQRFVANRGDLGTVARAQLRAYLDANRDSIVECPPATPLLARRDFPSRSGPESDLLAPSVHLAQRLARCTADLHRELGAHTADPAFAPDPFTPLSQRSLYQRIRTLIVSVLDDVRQRTTQLPEALQPVARALVEHEASIVQRVAPLLRTRLVALRCRCHGNYHLRQVLDTGDDLVIIDFEGEPGRPLFERRLKRSPVQDIATMVRSFHYAAQAALADARGAAADAASAARLAAWAAHWQERVSVAFVQAYRDEMRDSALVPPTPEEWHLLFSAHLLERAVYELGFELRHRHARVHIPLLELRSLVESEDEAAPR